MASILIVEDGTNIPNANSYYSLANIRTYASNRGVILPVLDADADAMVLKAMDYIESKRSQFQGLKTTATQALQFPRCLPYYYNVGNSYPYYPPPTTSIYGIIIDGVQIASNVIPEVLKVIVCQCTMAINEGVDFANLAQSQQFVTKEKIGPLEVDYSESVSTSTSVSVDSIDELFDVLFYPNGSNGSFLTVRRV